MVFNHIDQITSQQNGSCLIRTAYPFLVSLIYRTTKLAEL